ncbi:MAG: hypothetical protein L0214_15705, partial [candidate division NC10 bacterium]|nr:hypothetical protein [candidate division NC10 bacterium]
MSPKQSWYAWIETIVARFDSARACAVYLGIDESKLSRWRRMPLTEPTTTDMESLAERTKTPLTEILLMVWAAVKERDGLRTRPTMGAAPLAVPSPKSAAVPQPLRARRRKGRAVGGL